MTTGMEEMYMAMMTWKSVEVIGPVDMTNHTSLQSHAHSKARLNDGRSSEAWELF